MPSFIFLPSSVQVLLVEFSLYSARYYNVDPIYVSMVVKGSVVV